MNYLIDTHILLWFIDDKKKLSRKVISEIENPENNILISRASLFEIAIKINIGKVGFTIPYLEIEKELLFHEFKILELYFMHLYQYTKLPVISSHRDPFDRILIAQALQDDLTTITHDKDFKNYKVKILFQS